MEKEPVGSVPVNPMVADNTEEAPVETAPVENKPEDKPAESPDAAKIAQLEKMLNDSKSMIGKQSSEVGSLRKQLEGLQQAQPKGPSIEDQIDEISDKMELGEIGLKDGNRQIAQLSAQMGERSAMNKFNQQKEQDRIGTIQQKFLKDNPDFEGLRANGALTPYMEADPLADEYVAFKQYKADEKIKALDAEYQGKIAAAKEEGAKLAQGAEAAGKVLGKSGSAARVAVTTPKPFKSSQEAQDAMLSTLRDMRSATP
jgi:hypothetical protein